ncbi:ATP-binding cassette subfamily A (ABC1) member 5 [Clonorchis sinensis]|uniref:ATP-binding cassette subfamily A (ABC1) member 5 n=1 Tax=Clonorchis sinensis TaxID=79923 RepID=G7YGJ7_CLOSI|nr:ATP-binding cassette subfamily A (ABC1) member 5 [Clonorchis sinensis]
MALCCGQTAELMRRMVLVHFLRGPTGIAALCLSVLLIVGSAFWPTVGLLVITSREASLIGEKSIEPSCVPVSLKNWLVGYEGQQDDPTLVDLSQRLWAYLGELQKDSNPRHWCGTLHNCSKRVFDETNPTRSSLLYPLNTHYIFLVRRVYGNIHGYHSYAPYQAFFSPDIAMGVYLPFKQQVDEFFYKEHQINLENSTSPPKLGIRVAALKRDVYAESPFRWSAENYGKQFITSIMCAHQYLGTACLAVCIASLMCLDKETGFRPLMALMGMRRISYMLAHFIVCQIGVLPLAALGTLVLWTLGGDLSKHPLTPTEYGQIFGTNILLSWHQFGIGLIVCALARSTRMVLFPLLALFAMGVVAQLVMINQVFEDVTWHRWSKIDNYGYIVPSYAYSSLILQILNKEMVSTEETHTYFYTHAQVVHAAIAILLGTYLDCISSSGTGHKYEWNFPVVFIKMFFQALDVNYASMEQSSIFIKGNTNRTIDRLVEESKLEFTRVWLQGVTKDYVRWRGWSKTKFRAVSKVNLLLQKGEITAILGHNGAGKTTIFSILAGLQPATGGHIRIFGKNPLDAWDAINLRKITGVCTQFDVLDDRLTAYEHMRLLGAIKGVSYHSAHRETMKLFAQLELDSYTHTATNLLPGGDKRKLSVAMALLGSPRLIMLDEPTSGVDPFSRRCIWKVLRNYRPNRVIVLITHYMDEADVLADRKAIMISGRLVCYGTSRFLKENYNPGYMLNVTLTNKWDNSSRLKRFLCDRLSGVSFVREFTEQLTFFIQPNAMSPLMLLIFSNEGQNQLTQCGVASFGFTVTSLEEIFLKLGAEPLDRDDETLLAKPDEKPRQHRRSYAVGERLKQLTRPLSIRSVQEKHPPREPAVDVPLLPPSPRSEVVVGLRQFGLLIRVLLGLLMLPTPLYILLRSFLPMIMVGVSSIVYYVETTNFPRTVEMEHYDYITRTNITDTRQHISIAYPVNSEGNWSTVVNQTLFEEDLVCLRNQLGPKEPYFVKLPFWRELSPTGYSEDAIHPLYNYSRFGSTRVDIAAWHNNSIKITLILGRQDHDLTQQIILQHFALWNCLHTRNLRQQGILRTDDPTIPWVGDMTSWESRWPETHPQLKLGTACIYLIMCSVANCILNPLIAGDIVREKELRILTQLHMYGMKHWAYWGAHFFTHIFQYLMLACFTTIVMFPFEDHILSYWQAIFVHNWINVLAALDNILLNYFCCLFFQNSGGATVLFGSTILIVIFVNITIFFIPLSMLEAAYGCILFIFPFADPFLTLFLTDFRVRLEKVYLFGTTNAIFMPPLWRLLEYNHVKISQIIHCFRILVTASLFLGANIYMHQITPKQKERKYYEGLHRLQPLSELNTLYRNDSQRATEEVGEFIRGKRKGTVVTDSNIVAFVYKLTKCYFPGSLSILSRCLNACRPASRRAAEPTKVAIANVSFLVNKGEICGILGPSGAGKSTLLECLASVAHQDRGQAGVVNLRTNRLLPNQTAVEQGIIGFCPQYNPIWPQLTVREHLVIYSVMRDINRKAIDGHVTRLISTVNLERYRDTYAGSLSGGCKRRLSMAISMVGDPSLIIMDEPSCGVDPRSRRNLWKTLLNSIKGTQRGCVVTTHFIDEGESLCDRLAILVNGNLLCMGSPHQLKSSYGHGLFVEVKIARNYALMPDEADFEVHQTLGKFVRHLLDQFPRTTIVDSFEDRICFQFADRNMKVFREATEMLLQAHRSCIIEDFSISSPTLEHVYFDVAKSELQGDNVPEG